MADAEILSLDPLMMEESLEDWVMTKCENWRDNYESNYEAKFEEYYRLWRGQWDPADSDRASERSRIISPALQQAVECRFRLEADAGHGRQADAAVPDLGRVGEAAEGLEDVRIGFVAAQMQAGGDVERGRY